MRSYFTGLDGKAPDEGIALVEEIFHLEDQIARLEEAP
jgi:L-rhamnose mutarotase